MTQPKETISLYFQAGNSDKEYHVDLIEEGGAWKVNFRYGRRGGALKAGTKCKNGPIAYDEAKKLYDKVVKEQLKDGYVPGTPGATYQSVGDTKVQSGVIPQLLNPVEEEVALRLLDDDNYLMQEKFNGHRRLMQKGSSKTTGINRKGEEVPLVTEHAKILDSKVRHVLLDGELIGTRYVIFDVLEYEGRDMRQASTTERLDVLEELRGKIGEPGVIDFVESWHDSQSKKQAFEKIRKAAKEGVVYKLKNAPYVPGRPASGGDHLKHKFYETASFVIDTPSKTKSSTSLYLLDEDGNKVPMGNVTVMSNQKMPKAGSVWEVRYLFAFADGALCQPVLLEERDDIPVSDCKMSQLKYEGGKEPAKKKKAKP